MSPDTAEITRPSPPPSEALKRTPLHALHLRHGAKMVPFAGYNMPVQYPAGLLKEHLHTRTQAGLFDVSHMGQLSVRSDSGDLAGAARALEALIPIDILGLAPGRQRYGFLTNEAGGILDDLMVANLGDRFLIVVNAANKEQDAAHLRAHLPEGIDLEAIPDALIALQGPQAHVTLARLTADIDGIRFMDARATTILGAPCLVARSGYTGEDGFEISIPADRAEEIAEALLADADVLPVGLGARDSLRLEAGLCLHGADIDVGTTPVEAGLLWAIQPVRRPGGARAGGFPGANRILDEIQHGPARRRVGLRPEGRAPVRAGASLFAGEDDPEPAGAVTSGGFGPSLGAPVAMGYLPTPLAEPGTRVFAELRGQRLPLTVTAMPFVPAGFKRS
ncbi:glycine cleavage system aminomethyltransferase GcvT [Methylobacterium haplocladii]|uniref:aminomethyltransferase n=3 Tax=Methylobacterium haplocladii TaxID=1176176 RepID=A0A512IL77_9HYPH|nr:glycine cleavage system aminomethyltransferase GcvT [Methylobacterium haplocladii]GEO98435.1 aminomethyltransferase [Methylobacterium haplocladii]GJD83063.1 Aminomethyltransferase [Methylobacterium haplocladii]